MTTMNFRAMIALLGGTALVAGLTATAALATQESQNCAAAKQAALGKAASASFGCHSKAAKAGAAVDAACIDSANGKWGEAFDKAELAGGCAVEAQNILFGGTDAGEKQGLQDLVNDDNFTLPGDPPAGVVDELGALLAPSGASKCQADKLKATGKLAAALMKCESKAAKKGTPVDEVKCVGKATGKLQGAFDKTESKNAVDCENPGDKTAIEQAVKSFVEVATRDIPRNDGCGSGFINLPETCDDGNLVNEDNCPADCQIDSCTPNGGSNDPHVVSFSSSKNIGAIRVFVDYPEGQVSIPGSGDVTLSGKIDTILDEPFTVASFNDVDHGLTAVLAEGTGSSTGFSTTSGALFTIHFETCSGAPPASGFTCTVIDAADPAGKALTSGVTCSVN